MLIVDTGVIVAAADRTDRHHAISAAIIRDDPGPLVTTALVTAEAAYLLDRELGPDAEAALYTSIIDGDLTIESLGPAPPGEQRGVSTTPAGRQREPGGEPEDPRHRPAPAGRRFAVTALVLEPVTG